jgi:hypothetical protein
MLFVFMYKLLLTACLSSVSVEHTKIALLVVATKTSNNRYRVLLVRPLSSHFCPTNHQIHIAAFSLTKTKMNKPSTPKNKNKTTCDLRLLLASFAARASKSGL